MSDEREKRMESDEPELETDEVEAHKKDRFASDDPSEEKSDEVEGHMRLRPKHDRA